MNEMVRMTMKAARVNVGLSQKAAAKKIGVSNKTLCNWEAGKTFPGADKIPVICEVYKTTYDNLIFLPSNSL